MATKTPAQSITLSALVLRFFKRTPVTLSSFRPRTSVTTESQYESKPQSYIRRNSVSHPSRKGATAKKRPIQLWRQGHQQYRDQFRWRGRFWNRDILHSRPVFSATSYAETTSAVMSSGPLPT